MKRILLLPLLAFLAATLHGADRTAKAATTDNEQLIAAVRAADDERLAATRAADRAQLSAIYSDDLHYAHSNGKIDTKTSQIQGITTGVQTYEKHEHVERNFVPAGPGIVLMTGRVIGHMSHRQTGQKSSLDLNYGARSRVGGVSSPGSPARIRPLPSRRNNALGVWKR